MEGPASPFARGRKGVRRSSWKCGVDLSLNTSEVPAKSGTEVSGAGWLPQEGQSQEQRWGLAQDWGAQAT